MSINTLLYAEINLFCILIMLLVYFKMKAGAFEANNSRLFFGVQTSAVIFFVLDFLWVFVELGSTQFSVAVNWTINELYYIMSVAIGYSWFCYSENRQGSAIAKSKRLAALCAVPMIAFIVLVLISLKTGWLFYIDANNYYNRGPLYLIQPLTGCGYALFTSLAAFVRSFRTDNYVKRKECRTLAFFVVPPIIGGIISIFVPGIPVLCVGITLGALYVYINFQEQQILTDSLTGLNNRNQMMKVLSGEIHHRNPERPLTLLMMDVDSFKQINDKYGHVEGDRALINVASALKESCIGYNSLIARYGGDEFAVICDIAGREKLNAFCGTINDILKKTNEGSPYKLRLSIGYAQFSEDVKTAQEMIKLADSELYMIKNARKQNELKTVL